MISPDNFAHDLQRAEVRGPEVDGKWAKNVAQQIIIENLDVRVTPNFTIC